MKTNDPIREADIADAVMPRSPLPDGKVLGHLWLPESFDEVRLFGLLMWRFGRPNGMLTWLGPPQGDPDGPFKWDFIFQIDDVCLTVIRHASRLEIQWWGREVDPESALAFFHHNLAIHASEVDAAVSSLEQYTLILNPFARHKTMAHLAREELLGTEVIMPLGCPLLWYQQKGECLRLMAS